MLESIHEHKYYISETDDSPTTTHIAHNPFVFWGARHAELFSFHHF